MINVNSLVKTKLITKEGEFEIEVFDNDFDNYQYVVIKTKELKDNAFVRLHSKCFTGDVFHSLYCDCYDQLQEAKKIINKKENGLIIYLDQEGRGIGLVNKLKTYNLQRQGMDTLEANLHLGFQGDLRRYDVCESILNYYNLKNINILTNNQEKIDALSKSFNVNREELIVGENEYNESYLKAKKEKMGHLL